MASEKTQEEHEEEMLIKIGVSKDERAKDLVNIDLGNSKEEKIEKGYKVELIRPACIYCFACAKLNPDNWSIDPKDQKAHLKNSEKLISKNGVILKEWIYVDDPTHNLHIAEVCPIRIIHVYRLKDNKRLNDPSL